jgi:predicted amidophosphoribosyltransferase
MQAGIQTLVQVLYPPRCIGCGTMVDSDFGLCGACWRDTPFISGTVCDSCGVPLIGAPDGERLDCDDCMRTPRPWRRGRAALLYSGRARRIVLGLKHGDRTDTVRPAARWLARAGRDLIVPDTIIAPVPLHWTRLVKRRYNQSALLARALAREVGAAFCPDLLVRTRRTRPLDGHKYRARFDALDNAIAPHPRRRRLMAGRPVLIVDDVMTSGATLAAATDAAFAGGAADVCVLVLARVARDA